MKKIFILVCIFTVAIVLAFTFFWYGENKSTGSLTEEAIFTLEPGESASSVATRLEKLGAIDNHYIFLGHLAKNGTRASLQQGTYTIFPEDTPVKIAERMVNGEITKTDIRLTFPEGWTARQMAERLTEKGFNGEEFLQLVQNPLPQWRSEFSSLSALPEGKNLEGFLFPDTYNVYPNATAEDIIIRMLENFDAKVSPKVQQDAAAKRESFYNALIIASIVEEEGNNEADRKMMADIFWKRLAAGQPFQSDVTVNYASGVHKQKLYLTDIDLDSPFNTYKYSGLTPTPISNPGLESINASVYPTPNPYYYFITDPDTEKAFFSETFQGHVDNREETGL